MTRFDGVDAPCSPASRCHMVVVVKSATVERRRPPHQSRGVEELEAAELHVGPARLFIVPSPWFPLLGYGADK